MVFKLLNRINETVNEIIKQKPDVILTIDSPGFCFRVIEKLKSKNKKLFDSIKKIYLCTLPEALPFARASTSETETIL